MTRREIDAATELHLRAQVKQQLRTRMRGLRRVLPEEARAARSAAICARLLSLPAFERASTVVGYRATRAEADASQALLAAEKLGKHVGLPRILEDGGLQLHRYRSGDPLEQSGFGVDEPRPDAPAICDDDVQLIIIPALAFDDRGHRIGYGQGFYDRLLPRLPDAFKVVIGFDFQRVVETPDMPGDIAAHAIVTDARTIIVA